MGVKTRKLGNINDQLVEWQAVHVADGSTALTTVAGRGYFIDTTSATQAVNLPASGSSSLGDTIMLKDYARKWATNAITLGSNTFDGNTNTPTFNTAGQTLTFVHMGGTKGWSLINEDTTTDQGTQYIAATGGTVATSGDFKIHTFTGDGNFVVSQAGNSAGSNKVSYVVVAGAGGGSSGDVGAGGGAGGYREGRAPAFDSYTASPLVAPDGLPVSAQTYPVTVGGGGSGTPNSASSTQASTGTPATFSTITSAGGGGGGGSTSGTKNGGAGGSGGGGSHSGNGNGGAGNTPPVSPPQGNNGGNGPGAGSPAYGSGGGGGAGAVGANGSASNGGNGGAGVTSEITASSVARAGGGAGSRDCNSGPFATGGTGGGGNSAGSQGAGSNGSANTGGGGGGASGPGGGGGGGAGGTGGKGVVIIRYKFQN